MTQFNLMSSIGWAKQIPGFSSLPLNDQMRLLQSTWAEILTFSLAWRSIPNCGKLRFAQDFTLDERLARECHCLELFSHVRNTRFTFKHSRLHWKLIIIFILTVYASCWEASASGSGARGVLCNESSNFDQQWCQAWWTTRSAAFSRKYPCLIVGLH